jgi:hypothetical protein
VIRRSLAENLADTVAFQPFLDVLDAKANASPGQSYEWQGIGCAEPITVKGPLCYVDVRRRLAFGKERLCI